MILITGPTGCIGKAVVERLTSSGHPVKLLWHWDHEHLAPRRVSIVGGDVRNVKSLVDAMEDVDTVIHLASQRRDNGNDRVEEVNAAGTRNVVDAAKRAHVSRLISVSCLGAEARSAYPYLRSMGKAEEIVRSSGVNFTVLKSAAVYGEGDWLTSWLNGIAAGMPLVMPLPHSGETRLQPIWVGDLAACIVRCLDTRSTFRQVVPIGGPQSLTLADVAAITLNATRRKRRFIRIPTSMTRQIAGFLGHFRGALTEAELDSLSYNRTTEIGSVHRMFGFAPAKMPTKLAHLRPDRELPPLPVRFPQQTAFARSR
ncbi:MAG: NAD(P)H-binding protein [Chloroflexi bacterium]|nr:NAD(P)H-binding protein [Chloroflexota bacterium]MCL5274369.1 NAD(P)H-binding protein [Chloroflexota bacterium]